MGYALLSCEKPWDASQLRVGCKAHVIHREHQLALWCRHGLKPNALNWYPQFQELRLGGVVRVRFWRQRLEAFLDLNQREVPFEGSIRCIFERLAARSHICIGTDTGRREIAYSGFCEAKATNETFAVARNVVLAGERVGHAVEEFRDKGIDLAF